MIDTIIEGHLKVHVVTGACTCKACFRYHGIDTIGRIVEKRID